MKKTILIILTLFIQLFAVENNLYLTQEERNWIKDNKTLKVCAYKTQYPFIIVENNKVQGLSAEFLKIISKKINLNIEFNISNTVNENFQKTKDGLCHIHPIIVTKPNTHKFLNPTLPYISDNIVLVTKINEPYISDLANLKDEKIAIREGYKNLKKHIKNIYPNLNLIEIDNYNMHHIISGEFYGFINASYQVSYDIATKYYNELKIMSKIGDNKLDGSFGIITREPILLSIFNKVINNISTLEKQKIENAWLKIEVEKQFDYTLLWQILAISFIIIFIIIVAYLKQLKLHKEIQILNTSLEDKVKNEVEKNRQKDKLMLQQSRLAQMGEMISMIAHQWRQPLNTLSIITQTLNYKYKRNKLNNQITDELHGKALKQIDLMSSTIDDFRNFFKPEKEKEKFCINKTINNTLDIIDISFKENNINLKLELADEVYIDGYSNELGQALLNILNNAKDALLEKNIRNKIISIQLIEASKEVVLTVSDNAGGINDDILYKIFDPYFSTKDEKNGTGLGLYMSKLIIEDHMNGVLLASNNQEGAVFQIELGTNSND